MYVHANSEPHFPEEQQAYRCCIRSPTTVYAGWICANTRPGDRDCYLIHYNNYYMAMGRKGNV